MRTFGLRQLNNKNYQHATFQRISFGSPRGLLWEHLGANMRITLPKVGLGMAQAMLTMGPSQDSHKLVPSWIWAKWTLCWALLAHRMRSGDDSLKCKQWDGQLKATVPRKSQGIPYWTLSLKASELKIRGLIRLWSWKSKFWAGIWLIVTPLLGFFPKTLFLHDKWQKPSPAMVSSFCISWFENAHDSYTLDSKCSR